MSGAELIRIYRDAILDASNRHGARNVRVIGSVARGDEREDSDIDLLVEFEKGRSLLDHAGLMVELEKLLGRKVEIASEGGLKTNIRESVMRDAVPL